MRSSVEFLKAASGDLGVVAEAVVELPTVVLKVTAVADGASVEAASVSDSPAHATVGFRDWRTEMALHFAAQSYSDEYFARELFEDADGLETTVAVGDHSEFGQNSVTAKSGIELG